MRKIKLFTIYDKYIDHGDYDTSYTILQQGISDWEEVTDEEFNYIRNNLHIFKTQLKQEIIIAEQIEGGAVLAIKGIKKTLDKLEKDRKEQEEKERKRREDAAAVRAAKKLERDKKALAKLIEQNPELVKELSQT